ncbi:U6 snRNA-associated Sm-like protein LSm6 [Liparis tanakae]|uniref:U6 snRNA-associated Sm-like protein LSm6 n=11 Tax=Percomorphaceae TaxID=1489872 RepID=A0A4Z2JGZ1_9TELE|nr:U6 snRNA-associated Sm-like protein LSm6 [Liparis tanakae]
MPSTHPQRRRRRLVTVAISEKPKLALLAVHRSPQGGHSLFYDPDNARQLSPCVGKAGQANIGLTQSDVAPGPNHMLKDAKMLHGVKSGCRVGHQLSVDLSLQEMLNCASLIGQYAVYAKYNRLEKVYRIAVKMSLRKQTPSDFLKQIIGRPVVVKLNSGVDYRGVLACLDGYMNIAIEQTEEYVNGQLKNKYGDAFLRGNNVLYISTQKRKA